MGARRKEEAIEALEEALEICWRLAQAVPEAYETDLARIARRLALYLWNLGRPRDAFSVTPEALGLREGDTARSWLESRPLLIALQNRAALARRPGPRR